MKSRIRKSGGSTIVSIPKYFIEQLGWEVGDHITFELSGGTLRIRSNSAVDEEEVFFVSDTDRTWAESKV